MNRPSDQAIRDRALDIRHSFIVQAPAGSGKTELLVQRHLALLASVAHPEDILSITFTRKAASEMRHRLLKALEFAQEPPPAAAHSYCTWRLAGAVAERDRILGWQLRENPSRLRVQTIDSFNAWLVRNIPWVSRFGGMPEVSDDPATLYREAVRRTLDRISSGESGGTSGAVLLKHLDNRMERLGDMLTSLLWRRDQWLRHLSGTWNVDVDEKTQLEKGIAGLVSERLEACRRVLPEHLWPAIAEAGRYAAGHCENDRPLSALVDLERPPEPIPEDLSAWKGLADLFLTKSGTLRRTVNRNCGFPASKDKSGKESMMKLLTEPDMENWGAVLQDVRELPVPAYPEDQWGVLQSLVRLLKLTVAELWLIFKERGEADFAEIALRALHGLGEPGGASDLLLSLDAKISHILVDEFQDTSYLQAALLTRLVEGWEAGDGRTLFLVGDPMQSIYRFREAEVGLFIKAQREGIGQVPLKNLRLSANFRSVPDIVEWVNGSFHRIFPEQEDVATGAVTYSPAEACRTSEGEGGVTIHPGIGRNDEEEARLVADLCRQSLGKDSESVAILVRTRACLKDILPALRAAGIGYLAQDIDLLQDRQAAIDLVSLAKALLHPADRPSWLSVLRAPWCGLSLADLHILCGDDPEELIPERLSLPTVLARLSDAGRERAQDVFRILRRGSRQRGRIGLRRLVEGCWLALGGPACYDPASLDDAEQMLHLIDSLDTGCDLPSLNDLDDGLGRLYSAPDSRPGVRLQIMTIHKAKGLEFDTVILPGLGRLSGGNDKPLLRWVEHPDHGLLLAPIAPTGSTNDPIYRMIGNLDREKEDLETARLIYVAATRARKRLHLIGHGEVGADDAVRAGRGSLLEKLWSAVEPLYRETPETREEPARDDPFGKALLRRLPPKWAPPALEAAVVPRRTPWPSPSHADSGNGGSGYDFATLAARHAGNVTHGFLERIGREGLDSWTADRIPGLGNEIHMRLLREGVPREQASPWVGKIVAALKRTVTGERGRWVLADRPETSVELEISTPEMALAIIDRTFVEDDIRWIVDYKTSTPEDGEEVDRFLSRERERYRCQLEAYREFFILLEPDRRHRAGLFFPMIDGWIEVD